LVARRGAEALAAIPAAGEGGESAVPLRRERGLELGVSAVVDEPLRADQAQLGRVEAFELDRAGQRAASERTRSAAPGYADDVELVGRERGQRHVAEERIEHRHAVEQH